MTALRIRPAPEVRAGPDSVHLRSAWTMDRMAAATMVALVPPLAWALWSSGAALAAPLVVSLATVLIWRAVFALRRDEPLTADAIATAIAFALMLPVDAVLWQAALGLTFGVVVGEQIFGGRGRNFLNPTVVALAFLIFSFPDGGYDRSAFAFAPAVAPGAVLLAVAGLVSWRVLLAAAIGYSATAQIVGVGAPVQEMLAGGLAFGVVFLAADPVAAAATNPGRWLYGLLVGALALGFRASGGGAAGTDGIVFAALLASIFAPLIDHGVVLLHARMRRRRYG